MSRLTCRVVPPVKSTRNSTRKPGRFGAGILASRPVMQAPFAFSDAAWWSLECSTAEDRHLDVLAEEAEAQSRLDRGFCC